MQVLDRYLKANGSNAQPWLLEEYSIAEVLCAPFVHNTAVTLPEFKHISLLDLAKEQGLERVAAWMQVCPSARAGRCQGWHMLSQHVLSTLLTMCT